MKLSSALFVLVTLLKILYTEAHFKPIHLDQSLSSPLGFQQTSALSILGQSDLKTSLAIQKTIAFMTILSSHPKLLCIIPPVLIVDFLTQLSCNPAILNAIPHYMLKGFMTSLTAVPTLKNAIPSSLFVSISNTLSVGTPDATAMGPAESPRPELIPSALPGTSVSAEVVAVITKPTPSSEPTPNVPGISVTKDVVATISPAAPSGPTSNLPAVSITKETTASLTPPVNPSSGPASNIPDISITKETTASITPISPPPVAPVLPSDLPTTDGIPPVVPAVPAVPAVPVVPAVPIAPTVPLTPVGPSASAEPSVPCIEVPTIGSPPTLPELLPVATPSLSPLSVLSSLFNKGAGNSLLETKIEAILKLFAGGNLKLPQLHLPEIGSTVPTKPVLPVKPQPPQVFILVPAPQLGKPEIPSTQPTKLYYKSGSLNQILDFFHQRLFMPSQKLTLAKPNFSKLSLPKPTPQFPVVPSASPIKCLPIFSKVPC